MATNISWLTIKASEERVWSILTKPEFVKLWQYGSELQTTWKVGTPIKFVTEWQGKVFEQWGTVLEYNPNLRLRYTLFAPSPEREDVPENYFEMIYSLSKADNKTILEIVQEDNRPGAVQTDPQDESNPVLKMLKELAEAN